MDTFLLILSGLLILFGIIGCFLPIIPGPPLAYIGLLISELSERVDFANNLLVTLAILTIIVTALDYLVPIWGAKFSGGSKWGIWGSTLGLIIGLFFSIPGMILGPFIGAVVGELIDGKDLKRALIAGWGTFLGFVAGIIIKLILSIAIAYQFVAILLK